MGGADVVVLLATVGLFAAVASVGHDLWAPFTPDVPVTIELSAWHLPYYAARSLLRMVVALAVSLVFTLVVATWAANWPSIFRKSTGSVFRYTNDDTPLPKSSSANRQPRAFSSRIT